ncbi:hypothetical protein EYF80_042769 [Liparis tanakae]|uniref:Uncharacterized protein n=1 Tax=Liparis tanakae TaxID=230148 RepID=A0A4Z2G0F0_9TELE|nr:hypothetical protein EYF80_042769 [Liparis tanakae]
MEMRMASFQSPVDLLQHPLFRKQHPSWTIIHQVELDILEAKARDLREDDFLDESAPQNGGHPVVSRDDDVEPLSEVMVLDLFPDVAHRTVHLLDHLTTFWGIWSVFMSGRIRFSEVQGDKVQVLLRKPSKETSSSLFLVVLVVPVLLDPGVSRGGRTAQKELPMRQRTARKSSIIEVSPKDWTLHWWSCFPDLSSRDPLTQDCNNLFWALESTFSHIQPDNACSRLRLLQGGAAERDLLRAHTNNQRAKIIHQDDALWIHPAPAIPPHDQQVAAALHGSGLRFSPSGKC